MTPANATSETSDESTEPTNASSAPEPEPTANEIANSNASASAPTPDAARGARFLALFTAAFWRDWFLRPCGGRDALKLAIPIVISSGSIALMNFADRVFLTWFDPVAMSASFQAGNLIWGLSAFPFGIAAYVNAFVAQYYGAKDYRRIGPIVWQGAAVGAICGPLFVFGTPLVESLFAALGHSPATVAYERTYWFYVSFGIPAAIASESFAAFFSGRREMRTVMRVGVLAVVLNVVLDYALIFGVGGYCRWGAAGAAIATAASLWFKCLAFLWLTRRRDPNDEFGTRSGARFDARVLRRLLRFGSMSSAQTAADYNCFVLFVLLVGTLGEAAQASTAIAINLDCLVFMPIVGIGVAVTTLVGNQIGAGKPELASRAAKTSAELAAAFSGVFTVAFLLAPDFFLNFYAAKNPEAFEPIRALTANVLRFVAAYLFADSLNVVFASALRGAGDAGFIMRATVAVFPPSMLIAFAGVRWFDRGVYWCWGCLTFFVFVAAVVFSIRFASGKWRDKRIIEVDLLEPASDADRR